MNLLTLYVDRHTTTSGTNDNLQVLLAIAEPSNGIKHYVVEVEVAAAYLLVGLDITLQVLNDDALQR